MKKVLKILGIFLLVLLLAITGLVVFLTATEFKPEEREPAPIPSVSVDP